MVNRIHEVYKADDRSYFAILKKEIHATCVLAGFSSTKIAEIDIVVAELVSNLVKHAGGGQLLVKLVEERGIQGIEIIAIDNGVGMLDVTRMVADGVSTKNTLGQGLGAMKRLSQVFQVYSLKDWGTVILIRVFDEEFPYVKKKPISDIRFLNVPIKGEKKSGDGFFHKSTEKHVMLFLGDGLGHGKDAEAAVLKAGLAFQECKETNPVEMIRYINTAVKKTRGLVGTVAIFDLEELKWKICGVGNITTKIVNGLIAKNYMSYNGILGYNIPTTINFQQIDYEKDQQVIMFSDGIKSRWDNIKYPAILRYDPSILTASIFKDYSRNTDDVSVATCKINV
jgi:anti-sigma regulatory factor (Ser/Thr protein kinase)